MSNASTLMSLSRKKAREGLQAYEQGVEELAAKLKAAETEARTLVEAAQAICDHSHVETLNWTEDGAYPNEPRSRMDCAICGKKGIM